MQEISAKILLAGLAPQASLLDIPVSLVTTDSRALEKNCVFVAFAGETFDGHNFVAEAFAKGAAYAVVQHLVPEAPCEKQIICPDSYAAMMAIGAAYRAQFSPKMIAITGSVGKTTTKEFCYAVLCAFGETIKTEGNQNNELGLPRTLLRLRDDVAYAAVEMGMNHAGEIARLTRCAKADAGIITSVGTAHIENLGSRENILAAKLEICEGLPEGAPLAVNYDEPYLRGATFPSHVRPVWFSVEGAAADVYATDIHTGTASEQFTLVDKEYGAFAVEIPALGRHTIADALAAYCAATRLGLDAKTAARALSEFQQTGMRQKMVVHGGVTVIEDCYNANPDSMRAALKMFADYPCHKRVALLGDMLELGSYSDRAHAEIGEAVAAQNIDCLVTYGEEGKKIAHAAQAKGQTVIVTNTYDEAAQALFEQLSEGDAILAKASRGIALEKALEAFYALQT